MQVANIANVLQSTAAAAERVFDFLDAEEESPDPVDAVKPAAVKGTVSFKNVSFGYTPERIIIHNFSTEIKPGQKIALVGPTGAGKTTIVKLLMRFYDINSGSIEIDGVDIRKFKREDLRSMFGMVLQDTWLFTAQSAKISATAISMPAMTPWSRPPRWPMSTILCAPYRTAMTWS